MRLGRELIGEVVDCSHAGEIPKPCRKMRVVCILKLRQDLTVPNNWRPLNLINYMCKLGKKVVAARIQDFDDELFHRLQYRSVRGRLMVDVLYELVKKAGDHINGGGPRVVRCLECKGGVLESS